ncbi:hypothetical protein NFI96_020777 [Prochilodus magdalenae]|nr:hypothetical protein NFI96_020777 [Prochilodus magdalenae]
MALGSLFLLSALLPYLGQSASVDMGIVNGTEAKPHSRPYMVSVQGNRGHICGGFLVSEHFVMTAAHCWNQNENLTVVLGAHQLPKRSSTLGRKAVKFYHIHPMYDSNTLMNDIMLLQLNETAKKSNRINWISIPNKDKDIKAKSVCTVAGWGKQQTSGGLSKHLMEVDVSILDKKACQKYWDKQYSVSRMVCAGGHGGFCQGDSGGPLVCKGTAVGIVSFTDDKDCKFPTNPNVYTKISKFLPWIKGIMGTTVDTGIVNGHEAKPHSRPYMVSVQRNGSHVCGGFLVSEQFVMTSAHCWEWTERLTVVLGAHELPQDKSSGHMAVKFYHIHPMYDSKTQIGDIMLLQLNGKVKKSKTIKKLFIPKSNKDIKANSACSVAGWGRIETNGSYSDVLREVNVTVKDKKECQKKWKKEYSAPSMICAGGHGAFCQSLWLTGKMNALHRVLLAAVFCALVFDATHGEEIINGRKAKKNSLQYMASVQDKGEHKCGGFLIDANYVLTAAHCDLGDNMTVVLGAHDISRNNVLRYEVKSKHKHPSYNNPKTGYDIMLLKLSGSAKQRKSVKPVNIPSKNKAVKPNTKCLVAGWGKTEKQSTVNSLLVTDVSTVNFKDCQKEWAVVNIKLPSNILCAGGYGTNSGACQGDSGGPLVCSGLAVGIVSFNLNGNCNYPNVPNVYTQISKYSAWIKEIIKKEKIINGKKAKKNSQKYMASVQVNGNHRCGGFLIDANYVLTAAHCDDERSMSVILGTHNIAGNSLIKYKVIDKHKVLSYKKASTGDDIMLLKLSALALVRAVSELMCPTGRMNALQRILLAAALSTLAYHATHGEEIINGKKAKKNSQKYMVSVQVNGYHICGGFLIDANYVLTAAHCDARDSMSVVIGTHNIAGKNLNRYEVIDRHLQSYKKPRTGNDIMLLKLSKEVKQSKSVKIIKIPSKDKPVKPNTKCLVAGWGITEKKKAVHDLMVAEVSTINFKDCKEKWSAKNVTLPPNVLCAGGAKSGACQGDSGGPLVCGGVAVGIVSFNYKKDCNYPNVPNIYTQISKYITWIKKIIKSGD